MNSTNKLFRLLNIQPGEGRLVVLLLLQYFCLGIAFAFAQTATLTLFLHAFASEALAYVYIADAVVVTLVALVYMRMGKRMPLPALLSANLAFLLVATGASRVGLALTSERWLAFLMPVLFQLLASMGNLAFWQLAARLYDVRQSKRLFGLVGSGQWIAIVITGFLMAPIVEVLGLPNLLILAALGIAGALVTTLYITRTYSRRLEPDMPATPAPKVRLAAHTDAAKPERPQDEIRALLKNRYIVLILALVAVWWLVFQFLDILFYDQAALQYADEEQLAGFVGLFLALLGIVTLASNFLLSGLVINRFGLRAGLLIVPVALVAGSIALAAVGTVGGAVALLFWLVVANKLLNMGLGLSLDKSAQAILYQPLPAYQRDQAAAMAEGVVQPLAIGLSGVALIALNALFPSNALPLIYALVALTTAWVIVAIMLGREYLMMLLGALTRRTFAGAGASIADAASIDILRQGLQNPHPGAALYSLEMLHQIDPAVLPMYLPVLLAHPAPEVRQESLLRMQRMGLTSALPALTQHLATETTPEVRGATLRALAVLGDESVVQQIVAHLDEPDLRIRRGVIVGLLHSGKPAAVLAAGERLQHMAQSPDRAEREFAAQTLGEAAIHTYHEPLVPLLCDEAPEVRRAALRAAGRVKSPKLWPLVLDALCSPAVRGTAIAALASGGESTLPEIRRAFTASDNDAATRARLAQVCGRIGGQNAIALLKTRMDDADADARAQVLRALSRCGYWAQDEESARVKTRIRAEVDQAAWLLAASADAGTGDAVALLQSALAAQLGRCRERIFLLLSFLYDAPTVLQARDNLLHATANRKAYALEVLDVLIAQDLKRLCFALFENLTPGQRLQRLATTFPQPRLDSRRRLQEIAAADGRLNAWTKSCAQYALDRFAANGDKSMLSTIERVIILKTVSIFAETADDVLAEIAQVVEEVEARRDERIIEKGDAGDSLYIIAAGSVRIHDGDRNLNTLAHGEVFGEMAVFDPGPRSASVTAIEDTQLLRLDQGALFELIEDRPEVSRGIMQVLSRRLRERLTVVS